MCYQTDWSKFSSESKKIMVYASIEYRLVLADITMHHYLSHISDLTITCTLRNLVQYVCSLSTHNNQISVSVHFKASKMTSYPMLCNLNKQLRTYILYTLDLLFTIIMYVPLLGMYVGLVMFFINVGNL